MVKLHVEAKLLFLYFVDISYLFCESNLFDKFTHYERLRPHDISLQKTKRSTFAHNRNVDEPVLHFRAFQRRFMISLTPDSRIIHPEAKVHLVDALGKQTSLEIDRSSFYSGIVNGQADHKADVGRIGDLWIIHIHTPEEFYAVEPLWLHDTTSDENVMIVYCETDLRRHNGSDSSHCKDLPVYACKQASEARHRRYGYKNRQHRTRSFSNSSIRNPNNMFVSNGTNSQLDNIFKRSLKMYHKHHDNLTALNSLKHNREPWSKFPKMLHKNRKIHASFLKSIVKLNFKNKQNTKQKQKHSNSTHAQRLTRKPRDKQRKTECTLFVIIDYNFYKGVGRRNIGNVVTTMVSIYKLVDRIFRNTTFKELGSGYGIVISSMLIHTEYSKDNKSYNSNNKFASAFPILGRTHHYQLFHEYCLVHITMQKQIGSYSGLAPRAESKRGDKPWLHGICAAQESSNSSHSPMAWNVGLSTVISKGGQILSTRVYSLVVAHEIGHNWGAAHDPPEGSPTCAPTSYTGGHYLMWPRIFHDRNKNADKFSPCSVKMMTKVLRERADLCFKHKTKARQVCGNGILEQFEDCDPGWAALLQNDTCCMKNCRFRRFAECSPHHHPCCMRDCQVAPHTQLCYPKGRPIFPCEKPSNCSGTSSSRCPLPVGQPNNTPCGENGVCWQGRCVSYCEKIGMFADPPIPYRSCQCDYDVKVMCQHCCYLETGFPSGRKCEVVGGSYREGAPCLQGVCVSGECEYQDPDDDGMVLPKSMVFTSSNESPEIKTDVLLFIFTLVVIVLINRNNILKTIYYCMLLELLWTLLDQ